jgi:hypothetical protein
MWIYAAILHLQGGSMMEKEKDFCQKNEKWRKQYLSNLRALYCGTPTEKPILPARKQKKKPIQRIEQQNQIALVKWARLNNLPLIAISNEGKRSRFGGMIHCAMGLTAGVSDLFLAMPSGDLHGFWIEMKAHGKKPRPEQMAWMDKMRANGYKADWFQSWEVAKLSIQNYLKLGLG